MILQINTVSYYLKIHHSIYTNNFSEQIRDSFQFPSISITFCAVFYNVIIEDQTFEQLNCNFISKRNSETY